MSTKRVNKKSVKSDSKRIIEDDPEQVSIEAYPTNKLESVDDEIVRKKIGGMIDQILDNFNNKQTQKETPPKLEKETSTIKLIDAINVYMQLCNNLEMQVNELEDALVNVLVKKPDILSPDMSPFVAASTTTDIVNLNRQLEVLIARISNLKWHLGV